jgi:hypothetical protein
VATQALGKIDFGPPTRLCAACDNLAIAQAFPLQIFFELLTLVAMVEKLDSLLEPDRNQKADRNRRDVDKKIFPRVDGSVGSMNVEHRR